MHHTKGFIAYLIATTTLCGALVMVLEVLGSRVIGPFFGVSLFVWTSLITVTMVALAAGYIIGGYLSDRKSSPDWLYGLILISGILVVLIPTLKGSVIQMVLPMGLRWGSLASAFVLFGPALLLLGCVSPYVVKIAAREMQNIGRTVGSFYAISTLGSVIGTLLTGFVLIAYLGVNQIFWLTGSLLIALSTLYFLFFRRLWAVALVAIVPFTLMPHEVAVSKIMQDGTHVELISNQDSFYGNIKVVDYSFKEKHVRDMMIDGKAQGGMDMSNGLSLYDYPYFLQFLPYAFYPEGKSCLVIGLGAGLIPAWYQAQGIKTEVVDIDPTVAELARKYFKFNPDIPVHIEDARYFLSNTSQKYDYMIMDAFNGDTTPGHLINVEAIRLAKQRLTPNGVFAVNLIGSINHDTFVTASIIKTLQKVFQQVVIFPAIYPENNGIGNIEVIAYDGPLRALQLERVPKMAIRTDSEKFVRNSLTQTFTFPRQTPAILLSDDFNPVDFYDIWLKELLRKKTIEAIDFDILTS